MSSYQGSVGGTVRILQCAWEHKMLPRGGHVRIGEYLKQTRVLTSLKLRFTSCIAARLWGY